MSFGNPFGLQFKVGIGFPAQVTSGLTGAVADSSIRDDGNATTSIDIRGTHTSAILVASGAGAVNLGNGTLTIGTATVTLGANATWTRAGGTVAAGTVNLVAHNFTGAGDSGGTSNIRGDAVDLTVTGANALVAATTLRVSLTNGLSTTNALGFGISSVVGHSGTGAITLGTGVRGNYSVTSSGNVTTGYVFDAAAPTLSSTGAITTHIGYNSSDLGHATLVTTAIGHNAQDITASATLTAGFRSLVTSGTGKWGFYASGTADNAFSGNVRIGSVTAPTVALDVTGAGKISTTLTVTGAFGCNTKAAQTAFASGGALNAYGAGANGLDSGANMSALHALVVAIRAALVANGIMS
jgi:hypothetical protein